MGANWVFLAFVLLIFAIFNIIFIGGFFKTAYRFGKPFVLFVIVSFIAIGIGETLHHLPNMEWVNTLDIGHTDKQLPLLLAAVLLYFAATIISCKISQNRFEKIDL